ncbi:hypothetical protein H0E87_030979, partial [Populus deltoides]
MKAVGSSELGLLPAEGDDEENGFVLASSWGENGKGELRWLLVKERLLLAGEGRRRCWNRLEREKENLPWPAEEKTKSNKETGGAAVLEEKKI